MPWLLGEGCRGFILVVLQEPSSFQPVEPDERVDCARGLALCLCSSCANVAVSGSDVPDCLV